MIFPGFMAWPEGEHSSFYNSPWRRGILVSGSWLCFGGQTRREGKTAAQRYLASEAFPISFIQGTQHGGTKCHSLK